MKINKHSVEKVSQTQNNNEKVDFVWIKEPITLVGFSMVKLEDLVNYDARLLLNYESKRDIKNK